MKKIKSIVFMLFALTIMVSTFAPAFAVGINDIDISISTGAATDDDGNTIAAGGLAVSGVRKSGENVWNTVFTQYRGVIVGISGVAALTFLVFFIINFMKLGQSAGNPQMRSQALLGIVWCGIACAGLGGITIFFGFFYNILNTGE